MRSIPSELFSGCKELTSVSIPSTVRSIGSSAFYNCTELTSVTIPGSVTSVGSSAFSNCTRLATVTIASGDGITLCNSAFANCAALKSISLPAGVTTNNTSYGPFYNSGLTSVELADGMLEIPSYLFYGCKELTSVSIPSTVRSIGNYAFYNCTELASVSILGSLETINPNAFYSCGELNYVFLPASVSSIGSSAFSSKSEHLVLQVADNSYAEIWAIENGIDFVVYSGSSNRYDRYALDMSGTSFYTTASNTDTYLPMTLTYKISDDVFSAISNRQMIIKVSQSLYILADTITLNGEHITNYTYDESSGKLIIPVNSASGKVQFCARLMETGTVASYAKLGYRNNKGAQEEIVGVLVFESPTLTLEASEVVGASAFRVSGITTASSNVDLYIGDEFVGSARAKKDGSYETEISIPGSPINGRVYTVVAKMHSDDSVSAETRVKYVSNTPKLVGFDMYYNRNQASHVDLLESLDKRLNVSLVPGNPFTFKVRFEDSDDITNVYVTSTKNGVVKTIEATETATKGLYIASGYFDEDNHSYAPGVIGVSYVTAYGEEDIEGSFSLDDPNCPDRWKEAVIEQTVDTDDEQVYDVTLGDGQQVQIEHKKETFAELWNELFPDVEMPAESSEPIHSSSKARKLTTSDAAVDLAFAFGEELVNELGEKVVVSGAETAGGNNMYVVNKGGALEYYVLDTSTQTVQKWAYKATTAFALQDTLTGYADVGSISTGYWNAAGGIVDAAYGIYYGVEKSIDVNNARNNINSNSNLTNAQKQYASKELDKLNNYYLALSAVKVIGAIGLAAAPLTGGASILAGLAFGVVTSLIGNYLDRRLEAVESGSIYTNFLIDPSGFVYEAVTSNRIQGAKVTAYYRETMEDEPEIWDATEYSQQNPLYTDSAGLYAWVTPEGYWQVKVECDGYEMWLSDWLPVPPVQDNVNAGLISLEVPTVEWAEAEEDAIQVKFTKYMNPGTVSNVVITDATGKNLSYDLTYDTSETSAEGIVFADTYAFNLVSGTVAPGTNVTLHFTSDVKSYADVPVGVDKYTVGVGGIKSVNVTDSVELNYGAKTTINVEVQGATSDSQLEVVSNSDLIASVVSVKRKDNENWTIVVEGRLPGETSIAVSLVGSALSANIATTVLMDASFAGFDDLIDISGCSIWVSDVVFTGSPLMPVPVVVVNGKTLQSDVDFIAEYENNVQVGIAIVTITGIGDYTGTATSLFQVKPTHAPGWAYENGGYYYYEADGSLRTSSWIQASGYWYYLGADGRIVTNSWIKYGGKTYYMGEQGRVAYNRWVKYEGKYYYLNGSGNPVVGEWARISGSYYYFGADGACVTNGWASYQGKNYYMGADGRVATNRFVSYNGKWYYVNGSGDLVKSDWVKYEGKYYYLDANGNPETNKWIEYNGVWYHVNAQGAVDNSWMAA